MKRDRGKSVPRAEEAVAEDSGPAAVGGADEVEIAVATGAAARAAVVDVVGTEAVVVDAGRYLALALE